MTGFILSRENHPYSSERVTPITEIPPEHRIKVPLPGGRTQILDDRLCYNWQPGEDGGRYVECGSVAADAQKQGFFPKGN